MSIRAVLLVLFLGGAAAAPVALAQPPGMGGEDREVLDQFDADQNGWLNNEERKQARDFLKANPAPRRGPADRAALAPVGREVSAVLDSDRDQGSGRRDSGRRQNSDRHQDSDRRDSGRRPILSVTEMAGIAALATDHRVTLAGAVALGLPMVAVPAVPAAAGLGAVPAEIAPKQPRG